MLRLVKQSLKQGGRITRPFATGAQTGLGGENAVYAEQMYSKWTEDAKSVHPSWDAYFRSLANADGHQAPAQTQAKQAEFLKSDSDSNIAQERLAQLMYKYRKRGHEVADIDPLQISLNKYKYKVPFKFLDQEPEHFGFSKEEIKKPIKYFSSYKGFHNHKKEWSPAEASQFLSEVYTGKIGFEYLHIPNNEVHDWIRERIENAPMFKFSKQEKEYLLDRIIESQSFSEFCEKKFGGAKRFGIDGIDSAVTGLEKLVDTAKEQGVDKVVVAMAHRGRLNTLACVFDKPYEAIFTEFHDPGVKSDAELEELGFSGDVKYHLGASQKRYYKDGSHISMVDLSKEDLATQPKSSRNCEHRGAWKG